MFENTQNIFLYHIDDLGNEIYVTNKKIQPGTNLITSNSYLLVAICVQIHHEMELTLA